MPADQPAAEMRFIRSYGDAGFGGAGLQGYSLSTDETCKTAREVVSFTWSTGGEKVVRVLPDEPTLVWATTTYLQPGGGNLNSATCRSVVRFTPQRDRLYDVSQPTVPGSAGCGVKIIDRATGEAAPGVVFVRAAPCVEAESVAAG